METNLYVDITEQQWPIIYRSEYNVRFFGLEKLHPFDAGKWGNIFQFLKKAGLINERTITKPNEATKEDLLVVHSKKYLRSLQCSLNVARIAEVPPLFIVPNCLVQAGYLKPMRYQTGGSILAGKLAIERGWAINIGGGFHHCRFDCGGGFCPYADITLLIQFLFIHYPLSIQNVMIVDLDAHQGNGHERDFKDNRNVYVLDVYNRGIYPFDKDAKRAIDRRVELAHMTKDTEYLYKVEQLHENAVETTKISRILIAVEQGEANKYAGKSLEEINIEDLPGLNEDVEDEYSVESTVSQTHINNENDSDTLLSEDEIPLASFKKNKSSESVSDAGVRVIKRKVPKKKSAEQSNNLPEKKRKVTGKMPWNSEEIRAVLEFFKFNLKKEILPGKEKCTECIEKYPVLSRRKWSDIKFYLKNYYTRNRKMTGGK